MKSFFFLFVAALAIACQLKTTTEVTSDSLAGETSEKPYNEFSKNNSTYKVSKLKFDALILPPAISYKDSIEIPYQQPDIITLTPVTLLQKTKATYPEGDDLCNQFPFLQVRLSSDSVGWVYGDQVMIPEKNVASIDLEGIKYSLRMAKDSGIGTSTDEGSTGCNEYRLLYLVNERDSLIHLVTPYKNLTNLNSIGNIDLGWFSFVTNEGVSISITSVEAGGNNVKLDLRLEYQEGSQQAAAYLRKESGDFILYQVELSAREE